MCDDVDNDCDGTTDEDFASTPTYGDPCGGIGPCAGSINCINGFLQCDGASAPQAETCDGQDNDCDGTTDEDVIEFCGGAPAGSCEDTGGCPDGADEGSCQTGIRTCDVGGTGTWGLCIGDIPPATEICDGDDNDCDGLVDAEDTDLPGSPPPGTCRDCPGTIAACTAGNWACTYDCTPSNHLECVLGVPVTAETMCDFYDGDCDGATDEGLMSAATSCGSCANDCTTYLGAPNVASVDCVGGQCVLNCTSSVDGPYADDPNVVGLDCQCQTYNGGVESTTICNYLDDDCDGQTDEDAIEAETCNNEDDDCDGTIDGIVNPAGCIKTCPNAPDEVCTAGVWDCDYDCATNHLECDGSGDPLPAEALCNGYDGNCDGIADDTWTNLGAPCDNGGLGECYRQGYWRCDVGGAGGAVCCESDDPLAGYNSSQCANPSNIIDTADPMYGATSESTTPDGLDNDCDGLADEGTTDCSAATIKISDSYTGNPGVPNGSYEYDIFVYEASRYNADSGSAGTYSTVACSMQNHIPWTYITYSEAREACWRLNSSGTYTTGGWDLCSAWQWQNACQRGENNDPFTTNYGLQYPYSSTYQPTYCNGYDTTDTSLTPTRNAYPSCFSDWGVTPAFQGSDLYDMSGNAEEWTQTRRIIGSGVSAEALYEIRGGSYNDLGPGMSCDFDFWAAADDVDFFMENLGFRCCLGDRCEIDDDCGDGYQCNTSGSINECEECDNATNCGPDCTACSGAYYTCLGSVEGCVYCNTSAMCGPTCSPCGGGDICWDSGSGPACQTASTCASRLALYNFDFEGCSDDSWTLETQTDSTSMTATWEVGTTGSPNPHDSGGVCELAVNYTGNYLADNVGISATAPPMDLSTCDGSTVYLRWRMIYAIESGWDYLYVEVYDGSWHTLNTFTATTSAWANYQENVSAYLGGSDFQVRFRFTTDGSVATYNGPYVNNVRLEF
jgi:hypothetical protein